MTVCPMCQTHIGATRRTCGSTKCGVHIKRATPDGPATHAYDHGQIVFMRRQNAAAENEARWSDKRATLASSTVLSQGHVDVELLGHRENSHLPFGRMAFGRGAA